MTACFSKSKTGKKHPYYMCFNSRGCEHYRKSIRRDKLDAEFAELFTGLQPTRRIVTFARRMFRDIWQQLMTQREARQKSLQRKIREIESKTEALLDKIMNADNDRVVQAYEKRIANLDRDRLQMTEKLGQSEDRFEPFEKAFKRAMEFLSNPRAIWDTGKLEYRQTVLKLVFQDRPQYCRNEGFRTPQTAYPFRLLAGLSGGESQMAETEGETSNPDLTALFDTLAEWEAVLQAQNIDFAQLSRRAQTCAGTNFNPAPQLPVQEPQQ